jgi:hypothetical protein
LANKETLRVNTYLASKNDTHESQMTKLKKQILSFLLIGIFLIPGLAKTFHHHKDHFHCDAKTENHFHNHHDKCLICATEFSFFYNDHVPIYSTEERPANDQVIPFHSEYCEDIPQGDLFARPPPHSFAKT